MHRLLLALVILAAASPLFAADNWPSFRGLNGQGRTDATGLPVQWSETQNVVWKTAIHGRGWSSPVVWKDQVWVTTATEDGHALYAVCVDRVSGKVVFDEKLFDVAQPQYIHPFNSYASPTPVIEEGRVYVTFGSPGTACLDTATGAVLWQRRDFVCNHFRGAGSSPVLYNDLLIMNFDGSDFQFVVALDKKTGKTVWRTDRSVDYGDVEPNGHVRGDGDFRKAFATPAIAQVDGKPELISLGSKAYYAYEPDTGHELWRVEYRESFSPSDTPIVGDGFIYLTTGFGQATLLALRTEGSSGGKPEIAWKAIRQVPNKPSPVLDQGRLFLITDSGIASALDARTGRNIWHSRIDGAFSASPLLAEGRIYLCSESGATTVIQAGDAFKVLASNQLSDGFLASPAVAGRSLFLRTRTHLYRLEDAAAKRAE